MHECTVCGEETDRQSVLFSGKWYCCLPCEEEYRDDMQVEYDNEHGEPPYWGWNESYSETGKIL